MSKREDEFGQKQIKRVKVEKKEKPIGEKRREDDGKGQLGIAKFDVEIEIPNQFSVGQPTGLSFFERGEGKVEKKEKPIGEKRREDDGKGQLGIAKFDVEFEMPSQRNDSRPIAIPKYDVDASAMASGLPKFEGEKTDPFSPGRTSGIPGLEGKPDWKNTEKNEGKAKGLLRFTGRK